MPGHVLVALVQPDGQGRVSPGLRALLGESEPGWAALKARIDPLDTTPARWVAAPEAPLLPRSWPVRLWPRNGPAVRARATAVGLDGGRTLYSFELEQPRPTPQEPGSGAPGDREPAGGTLAGRELIGRDLGSLLMAELPLSVAAFDAQGRYLYVNPASIASAAVRRGIIGLTNLEYCRWRGHDPEVARRRDQHFALALQTRQKTGFTEQLRGPAGQPRHFRRTYQPVYRDDGELELMLAYGREITAEHQAESDLQLFSAALDGSADAVLIVSPAATLGQSTVRYFNPAARFLWPCGALQLGQTLTSLTLAQTAQPAEGSAPGERPPDELLPDGLSAAQPPTAGAAQPPTAGAAQPPVAGNDWTALLDRRAEPNTAPVRLALQTPGGAALYELRVQSSERGCSDVSDAAASDAAAGYSDAGYSAAGGPTAAGNPAVKAAPEAADPAVQQTGGPPPAEPAPAACLVLTLRDVTLSERRRLLEEGRARVLALSLDGSPLGRVLTELALTAQQQFPGLRASLQLVHGAHLLTQAAPHLPADYLRAADRAPLGQAGGGPDGRGLAGGQADGASVCAQAVLSAGMVLGSDLPPPHETPAPGSLAELSRRYGVRSCWAVPFRGEQGEVLGVLALHGTRDRHPEVAEMQLLDALATLAGLMVRNHRNREVLASLSLHDRLTGLPNRQALMTSLNETLHALQASALTAAGRTDEPPAGGALGLLDLLSFGQINDRHGAAVGDQLLQQLARRLQAALVGSGASVSRLDGDEFGILLPRLLRPAQLEDLTLTLLACLHQPFTVQDQPLTLHADLGWTLFPELSRSAGELLSQAETAMYTARQEGELYRVYSHSGADWALSPLTIRTALDGAEERGELRVAYQPLVCLQTGTVRGFEALLRWQHPEYGAIGPDQFIPIAETSGLIRKLGRFVLREATHAARSWPAGTVVSVNVSGRQFEHQDFLTEVAAALRESGLAPARLELELTESSLLLDPRRVRAALDRVAALGVGVALDDYGVGYSNLGRLHEMNLSQLKLDRSFTRELCAPGSSDRVSSVPGQQPARRVNPGLAVIRSAVMLAHDLGLGVVAEGIETPEQWQLLRDLGCDLGQGYFFSRPIPQAEIAEWLRHHAAQQDVGVSGP